MIYDYKFTDTGEYVEADTYGLKEIDGRPVQRIYTTNFTLKGGGWHHTEYPAKGSRKLRMEGSIDKLANQ